MMDNLYLLSGNSNIELSKKIAEQLQVPLGKCLVSQFSDGETEIEILENVRGKDVFIIQSTSKPANHHIIELLLMADAVYRASARRITAVLPYFGYARQDKRVNSARVPISAKVMADLLTTVGVNHVLTVDLHTEQIQGYFSIPVDNLYGLSVFLEDMRSYQNENPVIISPDVGGVVRARTVAKQLNHADLAIIDKRRPAPNKTQVMNVIGNVKNRCCLIMDDMIDTGETLCQCVVALKEAGANRIIAYCSHPVLSGNAIKNIVACKNLEILIVTDSITLSNDAKNCSKIRQLSLSAHIAQAILKIYKENYMI
jgi:ribose-phosphate pyrophosphokinase